MLSELSAYFPSRAAPLHLCHGPRLAIAGPEDVAETNRSFKELASTRSWQEALHLARHMRERGLALTQGAGHQEK